MLRLSPYMMLCIMTSMLSAASRQKVFSSSNKNLQSFPEVTVRMTMPYHECQIIPIVKSVCVDMYICTHGRYKQE